MSRWDGDSKRYTSECSTCEFYREIEDLGEKVKICGGGMAYKFLINVSELHKCRLLAREDQHPDNRRSFRIIDNYPGLIRKRWRKINNNQTPQQLELQTHKQLELSLN